ncbi:MAG: hypothetical protein GX201_05445 [Clostridiales bacterium]|nr:hypothetical protein [Clostridiales bacterium]
MVFDTNISISVRCAKCGSFIVGDMSFFQMKNGKMVNIKCGCGEIVAKVKSWDFKTFHVLIPCLICGKEHKYVYTWKSLPCEKFKILSCPSGLFDIAFIGGQKPIRNFIRKRQKDIKELIDVLSNI